MKDNHSIRFLLGFSLSFLFIIVFILGYMLSSDLVAAATGKETGGLLDVWGPPVLISFVCSLLCSLMMLVIKDKVLVPTAFGFFAAYYLIAVAAALSQQEPAGRAAALQFVNLYFLPPAIIGNVAAWAGYRLLKKKE